MKVAELLEARREQWQELDQLCVTLEKSRKRRIGASGLSRFAALYRAACADLALAESHQLPPNTVTYLHRLVGRAHNQLYRSSGFDFVGWRRELLTNIPQRMFTSPSLRLAFMIFWGLFLASWFLAAEMTFPWSDQAPFPSFAEQVLRESGIEQLNNSFENWAEQPTSARVAMAGLYIQHNAGIGLQVFAWGLAFGVGGMFATGFNAVQLGAAFGYMMRSPHGDNFFNFVTAHGPFELTAIVLSAAAGMHLGFGLINTKGLQRGDALRKSAREAMPTMGAALILFFLAALVEAFISPRIMPYAIKAAVAVTSSGILMFYFVLLGQRTTLDQDVDEEAAFTSGPDLVLQPSLLPPSEQTNGKSQAIAGPLTPSST